MDYAAHYDRLIERARGRTFVGYRERHHIVPKCMGGGNEAGNIVELTGEEHYVAHQLLVKMHPCVKGLACAANRMAKQCTSNKVYSWLRKRVAEAKRGVPLSPEAKAKVGAASRGNKYALGYRHSAEALRKISAASKGNSFAASGLADRHLGLALRYPTNYKNLIGMVFGHLTVLRETSQQSGKARWICKCHCGKEISVTGSNLQIGQYSCGCTRYGKRKQMQHQYLMAA